MITVRQERQHASVRRVIRSGLRAFNDRFLPARRVATPITFTLRRGEEIVGGVMAQCQGNWVFVDYLWIDEHHRGAGHGRTLMQAMEAEGVAKGRRHFYLDTFGFQAAGFYEKLGYREFSRLEDFIGGHDRIYMRKDV
ncbi:MAG: GNAT family N-acetyltransferase [Pannonibacter sp.]